MNALHVLPPLFTLWLLLVWAGTRHVRQREAADRRRFNEHMADLRSVGPMPERWIDLREREGRE